MNFYIPLFGLFGLLLASAGIYIFSRRKVSTTLHAAKQGDPEAQYQAALLYYHGRHGVTKNWKQAFDYLSAAAQTGHTAALNALGALYYAGHGTEKSVSEALTCYQQSAEKGNLEGMVNLAALYSIQKDHTQAFTWMKKAADAGSPLGQRMLAEFYYTGIGTEIDRTMGLKYYALAAKQGEPNAVQFLKTRDPRLQHHGPM